MYLKGFINIDNKSQYDGTFNVDMEADIKLLDWDENSVDEILLSHFMMYVHINEAEKLFKRWYGWLKKNGRLVIETGDIRKICCNILYTNNPDVINGTNGVMQLYGWETTAGHTWGWCADTITPLLHNAGFTDIYNLEGGTHNRPERDITITCIK